MFLSSVVFFSPLSFFFFLIFGGGTTGIAIAYFQHAAMANSAPPHTCTETRHRAPEEMKPEVHITMWYRLETSRDTLLKTTSIPCVLLFLSRSLFLSLLGP